MSTEEQIANIMNMTNKEWKIEEIFGRAKEISKERKFTESIEAIVKLNVDPTQGDQNIRGTCVLPAGTGEEIKVCVFADKEFHDEVRAMGADYIGDETVLKEIGEGRIAFDKILATPEHMQTLKSLARILGPKGLMPNVKSGTLVKPDDLLDAVKLSKQGLMEFRVNDDATIMCKIGKKDFTEKDLESNLDALLTAVAKKRPDSVKGRFFGKSMVKASMGPTVKLDLQKYQLMATASTA